MTHLPLLSLLVWLPIVGGALCLALGDARAQAARWTALLFALATLLVSVPLFTGFDFNDKDVLLGIAINLNNTEIFAVG